MTFTQLRSACAIATAIVTCHSTITFAAIVTGSVTGGTSGGSFQQLDPPPPGVGPDVFQSPNLFAFDERQDWTISTPTPLTPDLTLPIGATVSSHYVVFDPNVGSSLQGMVEFDEPIVVLLLTPTMLELTSPLLGVPTTTYVTGPAVGVDPNGLDSVMIDPGNSRRLLVNFGARSPGDNLRVLTGVIPEPATMLLGVLALGGLALIGFRDC